MHILIGALVGGILAIGVAAISAAIRHKKLTWGGVAGAFAGGALAGAIATTTLGTSVVAAGGVRALGFLAAEGALSNTTSQLTENAVDRKPLDEHLVQSAALGAATGPLGWLGGRAVSRYAPEALTAPFAKLASKLPPVIRQVIVPGANPAGTEAGPVVATGIEAAAEGSVPKTAPLPTPTGSTDPETQGIVDALDQIGSPSP